MEINILDNQQLLRMLFNEQQKEQGFRLLMQKYGNNIYWHIRRIVVGREDAEYVQQLGDETKYETVEGGTHETTCIQSYSTERLGCGNYSPTHFGLSLPEVTEVRNNEDGTIVLTIHAVCDSVVCNDA